MTNNKAQTGPREDARPRHSSNCQTGYHNARLSLLACDLGWGFPEMFHQSHDSSS